MNATAVVQPERVRMLNEAEPGEGRYVLYWMQQSARAECNHALELAVQTANDEGLPLLVAFGLWSDYPEANRRHYRFLLEGLRQTSKDLEQRGIPFVVIRGEPGTVASKLAGSATTVVVDRGYLRHQKRWRRRLARECGRRVLQVESDVVVPVAVASDKREWAARTLRPKIHRALDDFLVDLRTTPLERHDIELSADVEDDAVDLGDLQGVLDGLDLDADVTEVDRWFEGGTAQARARLRRFVEDRIEGYDERRNHPELEDATTTLSPYLHFGHISPLQIALAVDQADAPSADRKSLLEELIVRRELAINFVEHEPDYDSYSALPEWARKTLAKHRDDLRTARYTARELEAAETEDPYWNAAMTEMRVTGFMHNYMRMYWGKKVLEWCNTPEYAHRVLLELNNRYFLDGRDPNSYANVGWIFGLHDRPWQEREIFGTVRYMSDSGLERKFDIRGYVERVERLR